MNCIFCKIVNQEIPSKLIYEDDKVIAFDDLYPRAPIHKLIIPRRHIATLNELTLEDNNTVGQLIYTAQYLAKELKIAEQGYRVVMNCNEWGGQTVFHIHLHLLGGRAMEWPPG